MIANNRSNRSFRGAGRPGGPKIRCAAAYPGTKGKKAARPGRTALDRYFSEISGYPVMSREDEVEVARGVRDGRPGAFERLIESNLHFVVRVARDYASLGLPLEDLINEGNIGLMEAAERFDPERGTKFISFAVWYVRKAIHLALNRQAHVVRLPSSQVKRMRMVRTTESDMEKELGRKPTGDELSARLAPNMSSIDPVHRQGVVTISLDEPARDKERDTVGDLVEDAEHTTVEQNLLAQELVERLVESCARLDDRQLAVISCRFGLNGERRHTLREVGERMGLSREGVRLVEEKALERLRRLLTIGEGRRARVAPAPASVAAQAKTAPRPRRPAAARMKLPVPVTAPAQAAATA